MKELQFVLLEIANKTYIEEQTQLQRAIFRKYNKRNRPVRNDSEFLDVAVHVYLMHISVNQIEQTITLNGHLYMTWRDEFAVWEPTEYNGVRITMVKQWEIWVPELRITNSNSFLSIIEKFLFKWSRIEIYPTFSIKIGCAFDYSAYPFDTQSCALGIYTSQRMSAVQLSIYYNIQPTVQLGWGAQSEKVHISDWRLQSVTMNLSYFSNGKYTDERPIEAEELDSSWTVLHTWINLKRSAFCFGVAILLPSIISFLILIFSFLLPSCESAIYILIANLFFLGIFLEDLIAMLPPSIGRPPRIVHFCGSNLALTTLAIGLQFWLRYLIKRQNPAYGWTLHFLKVTRILLPNHWRFDELGVSENSNSSKISKSSLFRFFSLFSENISEIKNCNIIYMDF
ncbi:unnamed protein product [Dracunculus medinensis]|uniref:Neur_chan_LBD domain-containing protein n=1 Tax=Dracunculus medinensis TaxID=318479 RepID=A0A158Q5P6_DRAME|nr:unnamed protein product [Dracunculus medinensis]